jgi:hypothetical protein
MWTGELVVAGRAAPGRDNCRGVGPAQLRRLQLRGGGAQAHRRRLQVPYRPLLLFLLNLFPVSGLAPVRQTLCPYGMVQRSFIRRVFEVIRSLCVNSYRFYDNFYYAYTNFCLTTEVLSSQSFPTC